MIEEVQNKQNTFCVGGWRPKRLKPRKVPQDCFFKFLNTVFQFLSKCSDYLYFILLKSFQV